MQPSADKKTIDTDYETEEDIRKKKKKKKKQSGEDIQRNLINYTSKRQGAIGGIARIVKKRNEDLENVMAE